MREFLWPYTENAAPDPEQPADAQQEVWPEGPPDVAAYAPPVLPAYAPIWPEGYPDLQSRRDSQVYNLLQQEAARAYKIREENRQIAAERADLQNNDKHKGRSTKMWHLFVASFYLGYLSYLWLAYFPVVALIFQELIVVFW